MLVDGGCFSKAKIDRRLDILVGQVGGRALRAPKSTHCRSTGFIVAPKLAIQALQSCVNFATLARNVRLIRLPAAQTFARSCTIAECNLNIQPLSMCATLLQV
jgi:hypothetical protein